MFKISIIFATLFIFINGAKIPGDIKQAKDIFEYEGYREIAQQLRNSLPTHEPIERRITNGTRANLGQFPYQAFVMPISSTFQIYICGGTLIRYNWILTVSF